MDPVKEAFVKIKEEIIGLKEEIISIREEISTLREYFSSTTSTQLQTQNTIPLINPTQNPTVPQETGGLEVNNFNSSTGNRGVPTNSQSYEPTNQQTYKLDDLQPNREVGEGLNNLHGTMETLDNIKKELRILVKRLTPQEMMVFSTLYGLESQGFNEISYKTIASNLRLSESSIRDYVNKLISKGIPIKKIRQNNKKILLNISPDLKKIASLSTIQRLREI